MSYRFEDRVLNVELMMRYDTVVGCFGELSQHKREGSEKSHKTLVHIAVLRDQGKNGASDLRMGANQPTRTFGK
jgi:hypothetical protein